MGWWRLRRTRADWRPPGSPGIFSFRLGKEFLYIVEAESLAQAQRSGGGHVQPDRSWLLHVLQPQPQCLIHDILERTIEILGQLADFLGHVIVNRQGGSHI